MFISGPCDMSLVVQARVEETHTQPAETSANQGGEENEENKEKEETSAAPRRRTRRD